jgi:L-amino acid N-acyltransferase YncA/mannose-6-phosphate isomerase-like protein (cupin superfamily)
MTGEAKFFEIAELKKQREQAGKSYLEFLRAPAMSAGVYTLPAGGSDPQKPHRQEEMYYVVSGRARMRVGSEDRAINQGSVIFVAANVEHRFYDIAEALAALVFFAPAESDQETVLSTWSTSEDMDFHLEAMKDEDWPHICGIYGEGIATRDATFETETPSWENWDREHLRDCRLVARDRQRTLGWAALSAVSKRGVYSGVAKVSIYVAADARGRGIGKTLLLALVEESERCGIWTLQAGIFPENLPSIALHKSCEFREVGRRQRLGKQGDLWRDVLLLERRSRKVGT